LGHASGHVLSQLAGCHSLLLECNHDAGLLAQSTYPAFLKNRIAGPYGHLSNETAAQIARALAHPGLVQVVAAHLSAQNNRPELALSALVGVGAHVHTSPELSIASPQSGTSWLDVRA
jgi:phosphoribosyl 1,2-cyclic phosphodiesterase